MIARLEREGLVFIVHSFCLICRPKTAPVLVSHTEAKVLLLS